MHAGQLLSAKLRERAAELLPFPAATPPALVELCHDCWADDPADRPCMDEIVAALNLAALEELGEERCRAMFPDVARTLAALRRRQVQRAAGGEW
jgi:hypothetical protein